MVCSLYLTQVIKLPAAQFDIIYFRLESWNEELCEREAWHHNVTRLVVSHALTLASLDDGQALY